MSITLNEVPQVGSLAKDLMYAAMRAPRMNKGGKIDGCAVRGKTKGRNS